MKYPNRFAISLGIVVVLSLAVGPLSSTSASGDGKPTLSKLEPQPVGEPQPALKYLLLPSFIDRTPGNAALDYNRLVVQWRNDDNDKLEEKLSEWREMPLEKLPLAEIRRMLARHRSILEGLGRAARRDRCDWQLPLRDKSVNPFDIPIPELQQLRTFAYILSAKARLEIAEGRFDDAVRTLQTGYAMARHIAETPLIIHALVGMAVADLMSKRVEELIAWPGSPNMYWALTSLPRPVISVRKAIGAEMRIFDMLFPGLRDIETIPSTPEAWRAVADRICKNSAALWHSAEDKQRGRMALVALVIKEYPGAKTALIADGLAPEKVEAMPVAQVVALHSVGWYRILCDDLFKWFGLPYWQASRGLADMQKRLTASHKQRKALSIAAMLMPALGPCKLAEARTERNVALLRTVEAVRSHAAANRGRLPAQLSDITAVPLPIDPITGKPFDYRLNGDTAVIDAPAPQGTSKKRYHRVIEIKLVKANTK